MAQTSDIFDNFEIIRNIKIFNTYAQMPGSPLPTPSFYYFFYSFRFSILYPTRGLQSPLDEGTAVLIEPDLISKKSVLKPGDQGSRDRELVAEALTRPWAVGPANYYILML